MHLRHQSCVHRVIDIVVESARHEQSAVVVLVRLRREHRQRPEIKSVAVLQDIEIVVAHGNAYHICDKRGISCRRAHP